MSKKIIFKKHDELQNISKKIDEWVDNSSPASASIPLKGTMDRGDNSLSNPQSQKVNSLDDNNFRFTIIIPRYLHKRIKKTCAIEGVTMTEKLTKIFEENFIET